MLKITTREVKFNDLKFGDLFTSVDESKLKENLEQDSVALGVSIRLDKPLKNNALVTKIEIEYVKDEDF